MKNNKNINSSLESDEPDDTDLLLNDFKFAFKKEYIIPILNKMTYIIQNNVTSEIIDELNFIHNHSFVSKIHDQFEYLKFYKNMLIHT